jgi:hypothetical protein
MMKTMGDGMAAGGPLLFGRRERSVATTTGVLIATYQPSRA